MNKLSPLFRDKLDRAELLALPLEDVEKTVTIAVHRNHSFELIAPVLNVFLNRSGIRAEFRYSEYDDSFSFSSMPGTADVHLIWLDLSRYNTPDFTDWLLSRISALREEVDGSVLVACCGTKKLELALPGVLFFDVNNALAFLGPAAFNSRLEEFSGTRLSSEALLHTARELGLRYLPALLRPTLKAIVLDCDNTLYAGVLAEDGIGGVVPYKRLQEHLKHLSTQGFLLSLASKNEEEDVKALFMQRKDFPLCWGNFVFPKINWKSKAENLVEIAMFLNIGMDSILFVDDNLGEITQLRHTVPELHIIEAACPEDTLAALRWHPGLFKAATTLEDTLRSGDIKANAERARLRKISPGDYLRDLNLELTFFIDPLEQAARVEELLHKTNQFILSLQRPDGKTITNFLSSPSRCIVTASMKDRLSDSGIIAVLLAESRKGALCVVDLAISCRALGRGVEAEIALKMVELARGSLRAHRKTDFAYNRTSRNAQALAWLEKIAGTSLKGDTGVVTLEDFRASNLENIHVAIKNCM